MSTIIIIILVLIVFIQSIRLKVIKLDKERSDNHYYYLFEEKQNSEKQIIRIKDLAKEEINKLSLENYSLKDENAKLKELLELKSSHIKKQKQAIKTLQSNNTKLFNLISKLIKETNETKFINEVESVISSTLFTGRTKSTN